MPLRGTQRRRTLRGQVSTVAALVLAAWLIVLAAGFDLVIASRLDTQIDDALRVRAQAASATVVVHDGHITGVRESATDGELDSSIWVFAGARAVSRPTEDARVQRAADEVATAPSGLHDVRGERFYVLPVRVSGTRIGSVVAAIDREPYEHTRDIVIIGSVVVVLLGGVGSYPVLRSMSRRALRPVERMTEQAAEWSVTAPEERFGRDQRFAELASLADNLDELLDRLAAVLRHERQLSAELSHELRTPLARIAAEVELLLDEPAADVDGALRDGLRVVQRDCSAMDGIIETLLAAARSEFAGTVGRCELTDVLTACAADDRRVQVIPTDLTVGVDADVVARMLAPVLDNARRYARSWIRLGAARRGADVVVEVVNDGPRIDPTAAESIFEPGARGDVDDGHTGAGLGLPLARRLARAADGDLVADVSGEHTTFALTLPAG